MNFRQALLRAVLAAVAVMLVFAGPSFGVRGATPSHSGKLTDFARTTGPNAPTPAQRAACGRSTRGRHGTASGRPPR